MAMIAEAVPVDAAAVGQPGLLRVLICGSVDDGKSTLIGRLLYDSQRIFDDQLTALQSDSRTFGTTGDQYDFALLMDGLEAEREQNITIDVGYRYFSTARRSFIVADAPGHEQFTRNMATGASNAELAVVLVDARKGLLPQTRRHSIICWLLGIRHIVLAINKIDMIGYDQSIFERIVAEYSAFASRLNFSSIVSIPVSARDGDNVMASSRKTGWYDGATLLGCLETIDVEFGEAVKPLRFPVQWVNRPNADFRGFSGTIASGQVRRGDPIVVAHSGVLSSVSHIVTANGEIEKAGAGEAVTLTLADEIDIARGDLLVKPHQRPDVADQFAAHVIWMGNNPLLPSRSYLMRVGTRWVPATVTLIKHKLDIEHLEPLAARSLALNDIGFCNLSTAAPIAFDAYSDNRQTGAFILVDRYTDQTVAAGMIDFPLRRAANIHPELLLVDKTSRAVAMHQQPCILWFTGLSGSGKSTIAKVIEARLHAAGYHTYLLDGDNLRHGLNRDLGFTDADRVENIRRIAEVARLFVDAGVITLCAFISPFRAERAMMRELVEQGEFIELFVDTPIEECVRRDPKGLYAKALSGSLKNFTGIDSNYEVPEKPEIILSTMNHSVDQLADQVIHWMKESGHIA